MKIRVVAAILLLMLLGLYAPAPLITAAPLFTVPAEMPRDRAQNQQQDNGTAEQGDLKLFSGKIVSLNGAFFILRDDTNQVWYHLDDQTTARRFAGRDVNVKGKLDAATDVIHVQSIEEQNNSNSAN